MFSRTAYHRQSLYSETTPYFSINKNVLISLHIRSMWETICDAWACWSGWNFGPNSTEYPLFWNTVSEYPPPPSPRKWKLSESKSESFRIAPENENCHRVQVREFQNTPPPPRKWNLGRSWHFKTFQFSVWEYCPNCSPPLKNEI